MRVEIREVHDGLKAKACKLIKGFWKEHNNLILTDEEAELDYIAWTNEGHRLFLIEQDSTYIGFAHLGSRGASIDWLEDLFVVPEYQSLGIGSCVINKFETIVKQYSESLYIEVAARNLNAIKLYNEIGYNCLNTITIRKDFNEEDFEVVQVEDIAGYDFEIRRHKKK